MFQKALTNVGGGYDVSSSTFTCPESGTYHVYFNVRLWMDSGHHNECSIAIMLDGEIIAMVISHDIFCFIMTFVFE